MWGGYYKLLKIIGSWQGGNLRYITMVLKKILTYFHICLQLSKKLRAGQITFYKTVNSLPALYETHLEVHLLLKFFREPEP